MTKRTRKPEVPPEKARDWLRRREAGESAPKIAKSDGFDVRTVRKHLETAKQEYETREARSMVLRNALESHYQDLCKYADGLNSRIMGADKFSTTTIDPFMEIAMRQHLPRSPIWKDLSRWEQLSKKLPEQKDAIERRLHDEVESDSRLSSVLAAGEKQAINNIVLVLVAQANSWAQGWTGLSIENDFKAWPTENGLTNVHYGFAQMGDVEKGNSEQILAVIEDFESKIKDWEQFDDMRRSFAELNRVRTDLQEELAIITHRRVVPGKCQYCPI